ncbi:MAG: GNAT family N-acetyltransferase [Patescibacteria group bacterium]
MKNTGNKFNDFSFFMKEGKRLTLNEKKQLMNLSIDTYPPFEKYYRRNKYYSTVKPQMKFLVKKGKEIIGTGKFLWRTVMVNKAPIILFAFGVLVAKKYQRKGLGTRIMGTFAEEAKNRGADILYGTTTNPIMEKIMRKLKFKRLSVPVFYKDSESKKIKKEKDNAYILEFRKGIFNEIEKLDKFYIGVGPL